MAFFNISCIWILMLACLRNIPMMIYLLVFISALPMTHGGHIISHAWKRFDITENGSLWPFDLSHYITSCPKCFPQGNYCPTWPKPAISDQLTQKKFQSIPTFILPFPPSPPPLPHICSSPLYLLTVRVIIPSSDTYFLGPKRCGSITVAHSWIFQ